MKCENAERLTSGLAQVRAEVFRLEVSLVDSSTCVKRAARWLQRWTAQ